jgi:hypothetical protein
MAAAFFRLFPVAMQQNFAVTKGGRNLSAARRMTKSSASATTVAYAIWRIYPGKQNSRSQAVPFLAEGTHGNTWRRINQFKSILIQF